MPWDRIFWKTSKEIVYSRKYVCKHKKYESIQQ
jgi:hypothetical protein